VAAHPELAGKTVDELVANLSAWPESARTAVRNQGGGHANHSFWWPTLGKGGAAPTGELAKAIDAKFGSLSGFQDKLTAAAWASSAAAGPGWSSCPMEPWHRNHSQPGQPAHPGPQAGANRGRVGARLLPEVPEPARRVREGLLPGAQLGLRERAVCPEGRRAVEVDPAEIRGWAFVRMVGGQPEHRPCIGGCRTTPIAHFRRRRREAPLPGSLRPLPRGQRPCPQEDWTCTASLQPQDAAQRRFRHRRACAAECADREGNDAPSPAASPGSRWPRCWPTCIPGLR
jgi:hypothetical protein